MITADGGRKLEPPLKLAWSFLRASVSPLIREDGLLVDTDKSIGYGFAKLDFAGRVLWEMHDGRYLSGIGFDNDRTLISLTSEKDFKSQHSILALDSRTGQVLQEEPSRFPLETLLPNGKSFVSTEHDSSLEANYKAKWLARVSLEPGFPVIWEIETRDEYKTSAIDCDTFDWRYELAGGRIYIRRGAFIVCLDAETGAEIWRSSITGVEISHDMPLVLAGNRVVGRGSNGIMILDRDTGEHVTSITDKGWMCATDDHCLYLVSWLYLRVNLQTGEIEHECKLWEKIKAARNGYRLPQVSAPAVSETHVFFGDEAGHLWAIEKETGDPVWVHRPKGVTTFFNAFPQIADGRLYIASKSFDPKRPPSLYCYEQKKR